MSETESTVLSFEDAFEVLSSAFPDEDLVLVGGQAVGYWLTHYRDRDAGLAELVGVTSCDVDFLATHEAVQRFATAVRGQIKNEGPRSPTMSVVTFHDRHGRSCIVDFLRLVHGLSPERVRETAVPIDLLDPQGISLGAELKVMHPLLCLESRVHNTHSLDRYRTPRALKQLDAAIGCARAFVQEQCDAGAIRSAHRAIASIADVACGAAGRAVHAQVGRNVLDAIPDDPRLGKAFFAERLPRIRRRAGR